jgi:hypothetical protein
VLTKADIRDRIDALVDLEQNERLCGVLILAQEVIFQQAGEDTARFIPRWRAMTAGELTAELERLGWLQELHDGLAAELERGPMQ